MAGGGREKPFAAPQHIFCYGQGTAICRLFVFWQFSMV